MSDYDISILRDEDGSARALAFTRKPDAPAGQGEASGRYLVRESCPCGCGRVVPRHTRGSEPKWATPNCRRRASERRKYTPVQAALSFDPPPQPLRGLADPPKDQHGRLKRSCGLILGLLQVRPQTGLDLVRGGGGLRFGARIEELRKRGHCIEAEPKDGERGVWLYRLIVSDPNG